MEYDNPCSVGKGLGVGVGGLFVDEEYGIGDWRGRRRPNTIGQL